jgi:hypothetical protein
VRVVVYDRTCVGRRGSLTPAWAVGARLYRRLDRIDAWQGVASWDEAVMWILSLRERVSELQYWGHGRWGRVMIDDDVLDADGLDRIEPLRARLTDNALVWFRTCETFGANAGINFAERIADFLGVRVAGHTYVIGFHQSGLHLLAPGASATWSPTEGLAAGTPDEPIKAKRSRPWAPHTITCLHGAVPGTDPT